MKISRQELARMLAPLTVLPGGDRLNKAALEGYYAVFKDYYPHEMKEAIKSCFVSCEFFPTPKQIMTRLMTNRRNMGSECLRLLAEQHQKLQLPDAERVRIQGADQAATPAAPEVLGEGQVREGLHAGHGDGEEPEGVQGGNP